MPVGISGVGFPQNNFGDCHNQSADWFRNDIGRVAGVVDPYKRKTAPENSGAVIIIN